MFTSAYYMAGTVPRGQPVLILLIPREPYTIYAIITDFTKEKQMHKKLKWSDQGFSQ